MDNDLIQLAERLGKAFTTQGWKIATAESCTGGLIAALITEISGSSAWFDRGFVTYSNQSKIDMLGVKLETLTKFGAVSAETAAEMVAGALNQSGADWAVAVTGIAGPDGGSADKPVGTVYIAWCNKNGKSYVQKELFQGSRQQIRLQTVKTAFNGLFHKF